MYTRKIARSLMLAALAFLLAPAASAVTMEWVTVGNAGNACDTQAQGCFGEVSYRYRISKYEVTNSQYAEFLNAVAAADPKELYDTSMGSGFGGITRSGSSGSFSYSTIAVRGNMPVNHVTFWDALRFANWLHNGQPAGTQGNATTERGAYTITPAGVSNNSITRNSIARVFIPSEDEWYKAAYYDAPSTSYFDYPAQSDTQTLCTSSGSATNTANCNFTVGNLSNVGSYTGAASPSGAFDQGGNVWEWNEAIISSTNRGVRGGSFSVIPGFPGILAASFRLDSDPAGDFIDYGFRVASRVPVPPVPSLGPFSIALLGSLLGLAGWRKLRGG